MPQDEPTAEPSPAQQALAETFALDGRVARDAADAGVVVADGRGVRVTVDRGHLVVADGLGRHRRERRFPRAERSVRRLVVLGRSGFVTLEAVRWCEAVGVALVVLDDGEALLASASTGVDDARLRRAQATAWGSDVGLAVAIELLGRKITAQADTCYLLPVPRPEVASTLLALADTLSGATTVDGARQLEAVAAATYFEAWAGVELRFAVTDVKILPHHWQRFDGRRSPLTLGSGNRKAATPINAILNYLYTLAGAEARLAALALGLDPGLGVIHADKKARASLALDLVEPVRPHVENYVLRLVAERTFRRLDFAELPDGTVRVNPPLSHELAATLPAWAAAVAPVAERVAHTFAAAASGKVVRSTPLTRSHHRHRQGQPEAPPRLPGIVATCKRCGRVLPTGRGTYCSTCWPKVRLDLQRSASKAAAERRRRTADGPDPTHTPESEGRRLVSLQAAMARRVAEHGGGWTPESFDAVILPALAAVELAAIMAATGVGKSAASRWRSGQLRPAPRKWAVLASIAGAELPIRKDERHA